MPSQFPAACIAPPLSGAKMKRYLEMIDGIDGELGQALEECYGMVLAWWEMPESKLKPTQELKLHKKEKTQSYSIVPLDRKFTLPSMERLDAHGEVFDTIQDKPLRDMAFHLLWHCKELACGREPITLDKLRRSQ